MKYVIALVLLASQLAFAGLPPTTSKGAGDSTFKTTFNYDFGSIILSHSGTTVTIGTIPASMLAIAATAPITLTNGTVAMAAATDSINGYLTSADHTLFNAKQNPLLFSSPLSLSGTTVSALILAPLTTTNGSLAIPVATAGANGYLSSSDFSTFNGKQNTIGSTAPITITSGTLVAIPKATALVDGYLASADFTIFNAKQNPLIFSSPLALSGTTVSVNILAPLTTTSGSLSIPVSTNAVDGYLSAADHTTFAAKQATISVTAPILLSGTTVSLGTVLAANGGIGLTSAIAAGNFLMSNGSVYSAGSIAVGSNLLLSNSGNVFTISHGTTSVAQGGTGLSSRVGQGQFLYDNGSAYVGGTIAAGTGVGISDVAGVITISNTTSVGSLIAGTGVTFTPSGTIVTVGTISANVTSSATTERIERALIANNGSCSITSQSNDWISSVSHPGAGTCTLVLKAGYFSATPACMCNSTNGSTWNCYVSAANAGTLSFVLGNASANNDVNFHVLCMGPR
jgi:uncharacterized membrane protein YhhN